MALTQDEIREIERDLETLIARLFRFHDAHDGDGAASLFTPDIEWITEHYGTINGSTAAAANINGRPKGSVSRHCIGNFVVDLENRDNARSQTYVTIWAVNGGDQPAELPIKVDRPLSVIDFHHRFVRTAEGWRIAAMRSHLIFVTE